jgi:hypothetical protein
VGESDRRLLGVLVWNCVGERVKTMELVTDSDAESVPDFSRVTDREVVPFDRVGIINVFVRGEVWVSVVLQVNEGDINTESVADRVIVERSLIVAEYVCVGGSNKVDVLVPLRETVRVTS